LASTNHNDIRTVTRETIALEWEVLCFQVNYCCDYLKEVANVLLRNGWCSLVPSEMWGTEKLHGDPTVGPKPGP